MVLIFTVVVTSNFLKCSLVFNPWIIVDILVGEEDFTIRYSIKIIVVIPNIPPHSIY